MGELKHGKYIFAWSRRRSGSVQALGYLGNLEQLHQGRRNVAAPWAGNVACLAPAAKASKRLLSWWPARHLPNWFKKKKNNALRTLFLLCSSAYTFQRAVLLGLSTEEPGRMDLLTCEASESATAKGPKSTMEKLPGLIWVTDYSSTLITHICTDGSSGTKSEPIRNY